MRKYLPYLFGSMIVLMGVLIAKVLPSGSPHRVVFRTTGCEAVRQFGLKPVALDHGCVLIGDFRVNSLSWVSINGIDLARGEVIALEEIKR